MAKRTEDGFYYNGDTGQLLIRWDALPPGCLLQMTTIWEGRANQPVVVNPGIKMSPVLGGFDPLNMKQRKKGHKNWRKKPKGWEWKVLRPGLNVPVSPFPDRFAPGVQHYGDLGVWDLSPVVSKWD